MKITEFLYCLNLVFSYPLTIFPANKIIESFIFANMKEVTTLRKWLKNLSRTVVVFLGCYFSILFKEELDDFLGVTGAVLGISIILIIPTLCHYKTCAKTNAEKSMDIAMIAISVAILILCTYNGIQAWVEEEK